MDTPLPSFDEAAEHMENGSASPLDLFIHENEPAEAEDPLKFRNELMDLLRTAHGTVATGQGSQGKALAAELHALQAPTRTILERIPADKLAWVPHERSMTLGRLGMHVAEIPHWIVRSFELPEFDLVTAGLVPNVPTEHAQIPAMLDEVWPKAEQYLANASDADLAMPWTMRREERVIWTLSRADMARHHMKHLVHHRGQLTVYLRLLDVPLPELFGPTADTRR